MNKLGKNIFTNWKNILRFKDVSVDDSLLLEADEKKLLKEKYFKKKS